MTHTLLNNITSYQKEKGVNKILLKKGTKVKVIGEHGEVLIVQDERGEKCCTKIENLKEI